MTVRDGRTPPFVWASVSALEYLREQWDGPQAGVRVGTGLSVYHAFTELANEDHARTSIGSDSGKFRTSRKRICECSGVSDKPVDKACRELERIGLLHIERVRADGTQPERPGSIHTYTLMEPPETYGSTPQVSDSEPTEPVPTSYGASPEVKNKPADSVPSPPNKKKNNQEGKKTARPSVNRKPVTETEYALASEIIAAFNEAAGSEFTVDAHLTPIVGRIREKPDLTADDHRQIIAGNFSDPWWKGAPGPEVIYGNAGQFERSMHARPAKQGDKSSIYDAATEVAYV